MTDPLIAALFGKLPQAGSAWRDADRIRWLKAVELAFEIVYPEPKPEQNSQTESQTGVSGHEDETAKAQ